MCSTELAVKNMCVGENVSKHCANSEYNPWGYKELYCPQPKSGGALQQS